MLFPKKVLALASGVLVALSWAAVAQQPGANGRTARQAGSADSLIVNGTIDWIEKSDVSALREGVIEKIEFRVGDRVEAGKPIAYLHKKMAELAAAKAKLQAKNVGPINSAKAKTELAISELARLRRLEKMGPGYASVSEIEKGEAELKVAKAQIEEATENQKVAEAESDIAKEIVEEHTVVAPFNGLVTDRMKNLQESVRANEPVVRLGRTDQLKFIGYLQLESASRVQVGDNVEVKATIDGAVLPLEQKAFPGKVISISREISTVRDPRVQILAEVNQTEDLQNPELSLRPGLKAEMRVFLRTVSQTPATVGLRTGP
jgi:multidrug efflux pump subunit AcrA (membrane-fusion protein)